MRQPQSSKGWLTVTMIDLIVLNLASFKYSLQNTWLLYVVCCWHGGPLYGRFRRRKVAVPRPSFRFQPSSELGWFVFHFLHLTSFQVALFPNPYYMKPSILDMPIESSEMDTKVSGCVRNGYELVCFKNDLGLLHCHAKTLAHCLQVCQALFNIYFSVASPPSFLKNIAHQVRRVLQRCNEISFLRKAQVYLSLGSLIASISLWLDRCRSSILRGSVIFTLSSFHLNQAVN